MPDDELTEVLVSLPNHRATAGESMWAKPLGDALYEIRNIPFYAYGLAYGDVVLAADPAADGKPLVSALVRGGGHRTLRLQFSDAIPEGERRDLLASLNELGAYFVAATPRFFAIDVDPDGDYPGVVARLAAWAAQGFLDYETCEARAGDGFDAARTPV